MRHVTNREQILRNLTQTVIARPLLDAVLDPANAATAYDIIIDPNLDYAGGRLAASAEIMRLIQRAHPGAAVRSDFAHPYIFSTLPARAILEVTRHARLTRCIYHIWEDTEVEALLTNSLATVKADAAHAAFSAEGKGILWAVIDSGIDCSHPHFSLFKNVDDLPAPLEHQDFTGGGSPRTDEFGHGSHVAGIIAGAIAEKNNPRAVIRARDDETGVISSSIVSLKATVCGMAPRAKLLSLKVLNASGRGKVSGLIDAIAYVQKLNDFGRRIVVHGVNLSVGYAFMPEWFACGQSPLCAEVNRLVRSGVVVVAAAGNSGYGGISPMFGGVSSAGLTLTINDPGNADSAITVGSTHRDMPHTYGVSYFSSKGPTGDGRLKPDLVAPGERILSCAAGQTKKNAGTGLEGDFDYVEESGTSMAAPHVSGVIAAFLSIRREYVGKPEEVKRLFMDSATDLQRDHTFQGSGLVDLMRAIQSV